MKSKTNEKKLEIIGAGGGFIGFVLFGLLYGALVGGAAGQEAGLCLFGYGAASRAVAAGGMVMGVLVSAVIFVSAGAALGKTASLLACMGKRETNNGTTSVIRH